MPLPTSADAALTATLPGEMSCALIDSEETAASAADACTTLRPLADAANAESAENAAGPRTMRTAVPIITDEAVSGNVARVLCVPVAVSTAVVVRLPVLDETPIPVGVSIDSADRLADAGCIP